MQYSFSAYSSSRKCKRSILKRAYLRSSLGFLIYLCIFSLLTVTHLDTWPASSCTRVTIWSILDLSVTSYSSGFSTELFMQEATQRVAALERDLCCVASTGVFIHTFPVVSPAAIILYFTYFTMHARVSYPPTSTSGQLRNDYLTTSSFAPKAWNKLRRCPSLGDLRSPCHLGSHPATTTQTW